MSEYEVRGNEIRNLAKTLVLQFMQRHPDCRPNESGLKLAEIFRLCGFDWGEYQHATSSNQQYWIVALVRELEKEGKVQRIPDTKHWKLR